MNKTKKILIKVLLLVIAVIINIAAITLVRFKPNNEFKVEMTVRSDQSDEYQLFYKTIDEEWSEERSSKVFYDKVEQEQKLIFSLPRNINEIRVDLGRKPGLINISELSIKYLYKETSLINQLLNDSLLKNDINNISNNGSNILINITGRDPYITIPVDNLTLKVLLKVDNHINVLLKSLAFICVNLIFIILYKKRRSIRILIEEIYNSKTLMWNLAKNDFKTRFAGSYLGIFWAFVQPIVTVLVYWFVFQVGFRSAPVKDFPYILWLISGIVPWFFFSEALMNATNSLLEYNYLVKKVVFKISILPIIKIISACFVHVFFILVTFLLFILYGILPNLYFLQVFYYTFCMFILILGLSYSSSAIILFFKDLGQIISICLQVGMWLTPIMWSYTMLPVQCQWILKLNPMYYIVEGYRDSLINKVWFWNRFNQTAYFWIIALGLFTLGTIIFKRLKIHFADVL